MDDKEGLKGLNENKNFKVIRVKDVILRNLIKYKNKKMRRLGAIISVTMMCCTIGMAQELKEQQTPVQEKTEQQNGVKKAIETVKSHVKLYGFVRNFFYYNSRENTESSGGLIELSPKDENLNELGEDLNEIGQSRFLATTTRIGLDITGPDVWKAKTSGKIEVDFNGFSSTNTVLRIRHAFFRLDWAKHNLILGQTWHPIVGCATPDEFSYAAGAPFNALNRSPQVQYNYVPISGLSLKAAAIWQLQYTSVGPDATDMSKMTSDIAFSKYSIIPEVYLGLGYNKDGIEAGAGVDIMTIKPRTTGKCSVVIDGKDSLITRKVDDRVWSYTPMVYFGYSRHKWNIKMKSVLTQNCSHLNMMSGYGVTDKNGDGSYDYAPLMGTSTYLDVFYGKKIKYGIYAGFFKNLGATEDLANMQTDNTKPAKYYTYYKGKNGKNDLDQMCRIVPSVSYNLKHFNIGVQYELTTAFYGTMQKDGRVRDTHSVTNHRVCGMVKYNF